MLIKEKIDLLKNWFRQNRNNLLLCFISVLVFLVLFEVLLRFYFAGEVFLDCDLVSVDLAVDPAVTIGWTLPQSVKYCFYSPRDGFVRFTTNTQRARMDHDLSPIKTKKRVLLLGDSFLHSSYLDDKQTMASKLQEYLGDNYEVINTGVSGYGTDQELFVLNSFSKYQPDIVVVNIFLNDFSDNVLGDVGKVMFYPGWLTEDFDSTSLLNLDLYPSLFSSNPLKVVNTEYVNKTNTKSVKSKFRDQFLLYQFISSRLSSLKNKFIKKNKPAVGEVIQVSIYYSLTEALYNQQITASELSRFRMSIPSTYNLFYNINQISKDNNFEVLYLNIPFRFQFDEEYRNKVISNYDGMDSIAWNLERINQLQKEFMDKFGYNYIDLLPLFKELEPYSKYHAPNDYHWSAEGADAVANELANYIKNNFENSTAT